jgi:hypothetical protein
MVMLHQIEAMYSFFFPTNPDFIKNIYLIEKIVMVLSIPPVTLVLMHIDNYAAPCNVL